MHSLMSNRRTFLKIGTQSVLAGAAAKITISNEVSGNNTDIVCHKTNAILPLIEPLPFGMNRPERLKLKTLRSVNRLDLLFIHKGEWVPWQCIHEEIF